MLLWGCVSKKIILKNHVDFRLENISSLLIFSFFKLSGVAGVHWRDPDLHEVIEFLNNPNNVIKANAAAYLQHLCYMDDPVKAKTRQLGGIAPLVALLTHDIPEIHRNASGALRYVLFY